ncbi:MAG: hypothetical protein HY904_17445 [Deltaproteobacteria bacterium]|nr:hypothetical protein [Deltaproteobacteria bacterium]
MNEVRPRSTVARAAIVVALGLGPTALWRAEIAWRWGWEGLAWVRGGVPGSAFAACLAGAAGLAVAATGAGTVTLGRRLAFVVTVAAVFSAGFLVARNALMEVVGNRFFGMLPGGSRALMASGIVVAPVAAAAAVTELLPLLGLRPTWKHALLLLGALMCAWPAGAALIHLFPAPGGQTDEIHAVKAGHAVFCAVVFPAAAMALAHRSR